MSKQRAQYSRHGRISRQLLFDSVACDSKDTVNDVDDTISCSDIRLDHGGVDTTSFNCQSVVATRHHHVEVQALWIGHGSNLEELNKSQKQLQSVVQDLILGFPRLHCFS